MSSQEDWPVRRITGILGIVFFVAFGVGLFGLLVPVQPGPEDSIADIRDFFANDGTVFHIANWILGVTLVFVLLPFAAGLRSVLSEHDVDDGMWTRTAYGIAVATVAVGGAGSAFLTSTMLAYDTALDDAVLRLILYADAYTFSVVVGVGIALFLAATSIVVLRTGALWKWLGWFGAAVAVIGVIGAWWPLDGDSEGPLAFLSYITFPLFAIWSLLVGINLLRTPAAPQQ